jgi:hypothetical protein
MSRRDLASLTVEELLARYAEAASEHGLASEQGDYRVANRQYATVAGVIDEMRRRGPDVEHAIVGLLIHPNPQVRVWAASHAREFAPEEARSSLQSVARGPKGVARLNAELMLQEWRKE